MESTPWLPVITLFAGIFFSLALGLPMAFALGGVAVVVALVFLGPGTLAFTALATFGYMRSLILVSMPLFILMA